MSKHWKACLKLTYFLVVLLASRIAWSVTLVHTNDVQGDIEPCGCRNNPQGGMARKANLLKRLTDPFVVQVDAGDLLFSSVKVPEFLVPQAELQASYLLRAMELLHQDVAVPGEKDFALGIQTFKKLTSHSSIHFLAANLEMKNGRRFLEPHVILTRPQGRVAIFGLVGGDLSWPKELRVSSAILAAKREVAALKGKADFVIAVTHQGVEKDQELAAKVPGIDVIVGGHSQSFLQTPGEVGSTLILQSSFKNQYVGVLPLSHPPKVDSYQLIGLDPGYESSPDSPSSMDLLVKEFKKALGDLNAKQEQILQKQKPGLEPTIAPGSPHLQSSPNSGESQSKFHTFPKCASCHLKQFDFWRKTSHAVAFQTLVSKKQERNLECLGCHSVGQGDPKGYASVNRLGEYFKGIGDEESQALSTEDLGQLLKVFHEAGSLKDKTSNHQKELDGKSLTQVLRQISRSWVPVQCENCHLPGREHPFSGEYSKKVEPKACLACHNAERAPGWYTSSGTPDWKVVAAKRSLITCPAGDLSEVEE